MHLIKIIFIVNAILLFLLSIYTLWAYKKNKAQRTIKLIFFFALFYFIGFLFFILRNKIPDFFSIVLALLFFTAGSLNQYVAIRSLLGLDSTWKIRYYIPISIAFIGFYTFTYIDFNTYMRTVIFSSLMILYSLLDMWLFWNHSSKEHRLFDKLSFIVFFISFLVFLIRFIYMSSINISSYYFNNSSFFVLLPNLYMLLLNIWVILLIRYRIKN